MPVLLFIFIFFQSSCKQEDKKSVEKNEPYAPTQTQLTHSKEARVFTTQSGKTFELIEFSNEDGLYDFFVVPKGFEFSRDTLAISGADPMSEVFIADLDEFLAAGSLQKTVDWRY